MTTTETTAAVDWVTLSTPEFVGWTRLIELSIPYPLSSGDVPYVDAPDRESVRRLLRERGLDESPVLRAAHAALSHPRLIVYAVRIGPDRRESKYVAVAGRDDEHAVLVLLDDARVSVRTVADTELAAGVAWSLPRIQGLQFAGVEVPVSTLQSIDDHVGSETPRTIRAEMHHAGLPAELVAVQEQTPPGPVPTGVLGAVGFGSSEQTGQHATRNGAWREFPAGAVLQIDRVPRHGEPITLLVPFSTDAVFRALLDSLASIPGPGA